MALQSATLTEKGQDADRDAKLNVVFKYVTIVLAANRRMYLPVHRTRDATRQQLIIDLFDMWIPATNLGYTSLNDGFLGIFGSVISCLPVSLMLTASLDQPHHLSHCIPPAMAGCQ